jgi:hypothetical protein
VRSEASRTDAIGVLAEDHRRMRSLFEEFEKLPPTAYLRKSKVAAQMIDLITVHAFIKREVLYPRISALLPEVEPAIDTWNAEHRKAEQVAVELWTMRPEDERFARHATTLIEQLRDHLDAEEEDWLPRLVEAFEPAQLDAIGAELIRARRRAPASPSVGS